MTQNPFGLSREQQDRSFTIDCTCNGEVDENHYRHREFCPSGIRIEAQTYEDAQFFAEHPGVPYFNRLMNPYELRTARDNDDNPGPQMTIYRTPMEGVHVIKVHNSRIVYWDISPKAAAERPSEVAAMSSVLPPKETWVDR